MSWLLTALFWILVAAGILISAVFAWAVVICGCLLWAVNCELGVVRWRR